ncbi:hypothetical protein HY480_00690 [Candidatus Uhrbacteria bacterium]|nr:hypothetical protein [Candidatus Uhrbacteria bacterium]
MLVIGLVGEKGGGKGTFVDFFRADVAPMTVANIRFSDILRETLALWDIPTTRTNLQDLASIMVQRYGTDALAHAMEERIRRTATDVVVLDGIRWEADVALLKRFPNRRLIYITADTPVRFERLRARGENIGDAHAPFTQFLSEERAVTEIAIPRIGAQADLQITNNGSLAEYRSAISTFAMEIQSLVTAPAR